MGIVGYYKTSLGKGWVNKNGVHVRKSFLEIFDVILITQNR